MPETERATEMDVCPCGEKRRQFWLWQDKAGGMHASRFPPGTGAVRSVWAATARDALLVATQVAPPKHVVQDHDDAAQVWPGKCQAAEK